MNFTYLVEGPSEPTQELLQRFSHYVVVVALTDEMSNFIFEKVGFDMRNSVSALCWIAQPMVLRTAPPGSALHRLHEVVKSNKLYGHIEHSFLASASREELGSSLPGAGIYVPLFLHAEDDEGRRTECLRTAVTAALQRTVQQSYSDVVIDRVKLVVSALAIVKSFLF